MFAFFILIFSSYLPLKFVNFSNFSHILRAHIWKSKRCFNVKSSTNYFQMTTKILADIRICISVPLRFFRVLTRVFFNMRHFRLQIFQPCYGTQRNHILDETGTKTIFWKTFHLNIVSGVCKFTKSKIEFSKGLTLSWLSFWNDGESCLWKEGFKPFTHYEPQTCRYLLSLLKFLKVLVSTPYLEGCWKFSSAKRQFKII